MKRITALVVLCFLLLPSSGLAANGTSVTTSTAERSTTEQGAATQRSPVRAICAPPPDPSAPIRPRCVHAHPAPLQVGWKAAPVPPFTPSPVRTAPATTATPHPTGTLPPAAALLRPTQAPRSRSTALSAPVAPGDVWDWGADYTYQLGDGTNGVRYAPVRPFGVVGTGSLTGVTAVAGGEEWVIVLRSDGTVVGYGGDSIGALGDGTQGQVPCYCRKTPVQAGSLTGIIAIGASEYRGLALRNDGAVFAWGDYALGNGTNNTSYTPVQVVGVGGVGLLGGVTAIAQGYNHSLALLSNGTVVSWGENQYGQLGDGTFTDRLSPVQVLAPGGGGPLMGVTAIATSGHHSMALLSTGVVVAWGFNPDGELGNGTTTPNAPFGIPTAVQVSNLSGVTAIAASGDNGFAIKADTSLVAWGYDGFGGVGDGTQGDPSCACRTTPVSVSGLTGVTAIAGSAGGGFALALKTDTTVVGWGDDSYGQLADGTLGDSRGAVYAPVAIRHLSGVTAISAGLLHGVAIVSPNVPATSLLVEPPPAGTQQNRTPYTNTSLDPVNTLTGAYTYSHTDLAIAGRGPSPTFVRSYNSNDTRSGPLGPGWTHSYAMHLAAVNDGTGDVVLDGPQGSSDRYLRYPDGAFASPAGVFNTLVRQGDGSYTLTHKDQSGWSYDSGGRLTRIADRYGNASVLTYNGSGQLVSVSDPAGRGSLTFGYTGTLLTGVTDWASPARSVQFGYDSSNRLHTVTDRNGKVTTYPENPV